MFLLFHVFVMCYAMNATPSSYEYEFHYIFCDHFASVYTSFISHVRYNWRIIICFQNEFFFSIITSCMIFIIIFLSFCCCYLCFAEWSSRIDSWQLACGCHNCIEMYDHYYTFSCILYLQSQYTAGQLLLSMKQVKLLTDCNVVLFFKHFVEHIVTWQFIESNFV